MSNSSKTIVACVAILATGTVLFLVARPMCAGVLAQGSWWLSSGPGPFVTAAAGLLALWGVLRTITSNERRDETARSNERLAVAAALRGNVAVAYAQLMEFHAIVEKSMRIFGPDKELPPDLPPTAILSPTIAEVAMYVRNPLGDLVPAQLVELGKLRAPNLIRKIISAHEYFNLVIKTSHTVKTASDLLHYYKAFSTDMIECGILMIECELEAAMIYEAPMEERQRLEAVLNQLQARVAAKSDRHESRVQSPFHV